MTAILADPDGGVGARGDAEVLGSQLLEMGGVALVDQDVLMGRLGEEMESLYRRCFADQACWREAGERGGVEQVVLVERIDRGTVGVRVIETSRSRAARQATSTGDLAEVLALFEGTGSLVVEGIPEEASAQVGGVRHQPVDGRIALGAIDAGKYAVELSGGNIQPLFATVVVVPGVQTTYVVDPLPLRRMSLGRGRWVPWVAGGLVVSGAAVIAAGFSAGGRASR